MVCFWNDPDRLFIDSSDPEFFYQLNGDHAGDHCRSDYSIHVNALQPEHLLYPEPRYNFTLNDEDAKQQSCKEKSDI